ncbi:Transcription factor bHLH35 [Linum perenne]
MEPIIGEEEDDYHYYWESKSFLHRFSSSSAAPMDEAFSGYYDSSSSPDGGGASSAASKNIVSERNRRKMLNERMFALRAVVPTISKLRVAYMGEKTVVVSMMCSKRADTIVKLCELFESLKLKIITSNISTVSDQLMKTVFVEAEEDEIQDLRKQIQEGIAALNDHHQKPSQYEHVLIVVATLYSKSRIRN